MPMSESDDRFYLCVTCGRLKAEELFEENDCTCQDCYRDGRSDVNWHEADDGYGYVRADDESGPCTTEADQNGSACQLDDIDRSDVLETVEENGPAEAFEIYDELYEGQKECPECGRMTDEYKEYAPEVRAVLRKLLDENRLVQTADWKYRVRSVDTEGDR